MIYVVVVVLEVIDDNSLTLLGLSLLYTVFFYLVFVYIKHLIQEFQVTPNHPLKILSIR
jgi:hypothetical protein